MNADTLLENFEILAEAPGGIDRLRELILKMAVSGQLVEQFQDDGDAGELIPKYVANQKQMTDDGIIGTQRFQRGGNSPQLPYRIPKNWRWHYLGDVGAIIGGGTPSSSVSSYWSDHDSVPWLTPADMRKLSSRYVMRGRRDITPMGLTESSAQLLPPGAVLFSSRAPIGHVAIAAQPLATNQGFKSCVPYIAEMNEYIYFFLLQIGPQVDANATGTTFKEVSGKQVAQILIPVPPLAEQRRIVAKVDELMALCDQLEQQQQLRDNLRTATRKSAIEAISTATTPEELEAAWKRIENNWEVIADTPESVAGLRSLILGLAVLGKLVVQISSEKTFLEDLSQIKSNEVGELLSSKVHLAENLPNNWTSGGFKHIGRWVGGNGFPTEKQGDKNKEILFCKVSDMNLESNSKYISETVNSIDLRTAKEMRVTPHPAGTVIFPKIGGAIATNKRRILIQPTAIDNNCMGISPCSVVDSEWLFILLQSIDFTKYQSGTSIPSISQRVLDEIKFGIPPLAEQKRIVEKVDELMMLCDRLESELSVRCALAEKFTRSVVSTA